MRLSPLNQRRWRNFTANRRAYWSMILFAVLFGLTLFAEVLANDKPLLVSYRGEVHTPFLRFYSEQEFGGDFQTEANYKSTEVQCLIVTGGLLECFDDPVGITAAVEAGRFDTTTEGFAEGWIVCEVLIGWFVCVTRVSRVCGCVPCSSSSSSYFINNSQPT
jgi:microcin C transport system permease protein